MKLKAPGAAHATTLLTVNWFSAICLAAFLTIIDASRPVDSKERFSAPAFGCRRDSKRHSLGDVPLAGIGCAFDVGIRAHRS
jgi:hypothetical protein